MTYDISKPQHVRHKENIEMWEYFHPEDKILSKMSVNERMEFCKNIECEKIAKNKQMHPSRGFIYYRKK